MIQIALGILSVVFLFYAGLFIIVLIVNFWSEIKRFFAIVFSVSFLGLTAYSMYENPVVFYSLFWVLFIYGIIFGVAKILARLSKRVFKAPTS